MSTPKVDSLTEFTKTKMHFALALLGTLFALHPFIEKFGDRGFNYLDFELKVFYAYGLIAGLLALTVYFYALAMLGERAYTWREKIGNFLYGIAIMVLPLYGGLYLTSLLETEMRDRLQANVANYGWAVALGLGLLWLLLTYGVAWRFRRRLGVQDRTAKADQLAEEEIASLQKAKELFVNSHYDLSVIESWKAIEARLRRVFLLRSMGGPIDDPEAMIRAAGRAHILTKQTMDAMQGLRHQWNIAVSTEPLTREAAEAALTATRGILATIPLESPKTGSKPAV